MNAKRLLVAATSIALAAAGALIATRALARPAASRPAQDAAFDEIDRYLEQQIDSLNLPGAALAIVEGDQIVHLRASGQSGPHAEAPTPQTPFFIGSLTKSITALAVMQRVEAGQVELDAPVQRYLPWFQVADPQASARMTVRHLLNQTSGLSQTAGMAPLADFDQSPNALERQASRLAAFRPAHPPGAAWEYSNANYNLLGLIVEAASGQSYATYVQDQIFTPLDMRHSYSDKAAAQGDGLAVGHRAWFGRPVAAAGLPVPRGSLPSGQLIASVEDMAHYLIAQLNGGRYGDAKILSAEGVAAMHRPGVKAEAVGFDIGAYGMGWFIEETPQGVRVWHNGQVPDYFAYMALLPDQQRGIVLLVNSNQMLLNFALEAVGAGAADLLAGAQPKPFPWAAVPWLLRGFLLIPVLQVGGVLITRQRVRRWQSDPSSRPGRARLWLLDIALPTVLNLALVALAAGLLAADLRPMLRLFMPDLFWLLLISGGFALVWLVVRTRLIINTLVRTGKPSVDYQS
jgi:CubicO group peptidase (beta-lactamase class C family)